MNNISLSELSFDSPGKKAALIITVGVLLNAAAIYFVILPLNKSIEGTSRATEEMMQNNDRIRSIIRTTNQKKECVENLTRESGEIEAKGVITPLLNSYAMRAKTLLSPEAERAGLSLDNVRELPSIPLQQPLPLKKSAYSRQPIEFTTSGSYTQLTAFVSAVEREFPMTILSSLNISAQMRDPETHLIKVCFEWPIKTDVTSKE